MVCCQSMPAYWGFLNSKYRQEPDLNDTGLGKRPIAKSTAAADNVTGALDYAMGLFQDQCHPDRFLPAFIIQEVKTLYIIIFLNIISSFFS